jgi:membrane protease YdiL (CAAX protease family)
MKHLESAIKGKNQIWRYAIMIFSVFVVSNFIGGIPLILVYAVQTIGNPELVDKLAVNPSDVSVLGIDPNLSFALVLIPFLAGLGAFWLLIKPLNNRTLTETINGTGKIRWNRFFISGLIWMLLSFIYMVAYLKIDPTNFIINNNSCTLFILSLIALVLIPFQAGFEEVLFRGYLMQGFGLLVNKRWFPLVMTSLVFGLLHSFNPEVKVFGFLTMMPQYILFGLIFGIITILDDGIEAALGAHAANNIFLSIMITNKSSALQTEALYSQQNIYPWLEFAALAGISLLFVLILKRIFRWGGGFAVLLEKIDF